MPAPDPQQRIKELEAALSAAKSGAEETIKSLQARLEDTRAEKALFERTVAQRAKERDEARKERDELRKQLVGAQTGRLAAEAPRAQAPAPSGPETGAFQKELAQAKEQLKARDQELARARSELAAKDQELAQARLELRARAAELDSSRAPLVELQKARDKALGDARAAAEELEFTRSQKKALERAREQALADAKARFEEAGAARAQLADTARALDQAQRDAKSRGEELERARTRLAELEGASAKAEALGRDLVLARERVTLLEGDVVASRGRAAELASSAAVKEAELESLRARVAMLESDLRAAKGELRASGDAQAELEARDAAIAERDQKLAKLATLEGDLDVQRSELAEARSRLERVRAALVPDPKAPWFDVEAAFQKLVAERSVRAGAHERLPEVERALEAARTELAAKSKELEKAQAALESDSSRLAAAAIELQKRIAETETLREQAAQVELDLASAEAQIADLAGAATARETELAVARAEAKKLRDTIAELEKAPPAPAEPVDPERTLADMTAGMTAAPRSIAGGAGGAEGDGPARSGGRPNLTIPEVKIAEIDALLSEVLTQAMGRVQPKKEAGPPRVAGRLSVVEGPSAGQKLVVMTGGTVTIGRAADASYSFHDVKLSRKHCAIEEGGGKLWLRDLHSQNGTLHNGARIDKKVELAVGDKVRLGSSVLEVNEIPASDAPALVEKRDEKRDETPAEGTPIPSVGPTRVMEVFSPPPTADLFAFAEEQAERTIAVEAPAMLVGARCDGCRVPIPPTTTPDARGNRFCPECAAKLS